ncbi:alpha-1,4-glucan:maltose-1-phosphate maltosyltransferase [Pontibaca methylaminivorans]|uniref:Alpha-1,4-glucan:maltose-1-phosphate maltosyltransferase n=1 Tax=Pontibaca methylaminivorans TaxID=515897 RepID=A0A1R3X7K7_9RHOB|nr:alpha-1,4-glucan:maltose-1-phosphate maltosyltransferase [Pontibaca methylaminivorans]
MESGADNTSRAAERALALARNRIAIEQVSPSVDAGRFAAKVVVGRPFPVQADVFGDGHDVIRAVAELWSDDGSVLAQEMRPLGNDRWEAELIAPAPGLWELCVLGWRDMFASWHADTIRKRDAAQDIALELVEGCALVEAALARCRKGREGAEHEPELVALLGRLDTGEADAADLLLDEATLLLMRQAGARSDLTRHPGLPLRADRDAAAFGAWYEMMPRSWGRDGAHGTFDDVIARLPYVRDLGFDVLYFPPIHPIGTTNRKGPNNALTAGPEDPGSPYAIGSAEGGHCAVHPELGTLEDFRRLVTEAAAEGIEIALDFAIQCSPDHPWIREHPEWFDWRPDGSLKFAENPPKKYEDIVNVHFYREALPSLWLALRDVVLFWIGQGVRIFRVDNPHTKPFPFWEWLIAEVQADHPDTIFLAEAFTRPKVMKRLAKLGFTQSYSYFTWRHSKAELTDYLTELTQTGCRDYMRVNFFANTPDINPYFLQSSGRPGFRTRLVLAATLAGNYGIYNGFEICESAPLPGREEYLDSEKYQLRQWDFDRPGHIRDDIRLINRIRRDHPAMHDSGNLRFLPAHHDQVLCYRRFDFEAGSFLLFHVNLDPRTAHDFMFELPLSEFGLPDDGSIEVEDLLHGNRFTWHGRHHWLTLDPETRPYAIWRLFPPGSAQ